MAKTEKSPPRRPAEEAGKSNTKDKKKPLKKNSTVKKKVASVKKAGSSTKKAAAVVKKTASIKKAKSTTSSKPEKKSSRYYEAVGRRKKATARVRLFTRGEREFSVNKKPYTDYFPTAELRMLADGALRKMKVMDKFKITVLVQGGGISGQAEAVRHGTARALLKFNADFRKRLKRAGFLRRDPRKTERKKFGLKKARRAPQWSKR